MNLTNKTNNYKNKTNNYKNKIDNMKYNYNNIDTSRCNNLKRLKKVNNK